MANAVTNNEAKSQYELHVDGGTAIAVYQRRGDVMTFVHTEVPVALRGKGIAAQLIASALEDVRRQGLTIIPRCPYVVNYVERHPEVQDLVVE